MKDYECCLPVVFAALAVLVMGCMNFKCFQAMSKDGKTRSEYPCYRWLALFALIAGCFVACLQKAK